MRLFVAIDLPKEIQEYMSNIQDKIKLDSIEQRFTNSYHLTLKFLGEIKEDDLQKIVQSLSSIKFKDFKLSTKRIGIFPNEKYIKVVWIGLDENRELRKLQEDIEKSLEKFNLKKDFNFHPHITLSRVSNIEERKVFLNNIKKISTKELSFDVKDFFLYESILKREGPIYNKIKGFPCSCHVF